MKSIKFYIIVILVIILSGCEDLEILQEHPYKAAAETFLTNAEKVESIIFSCYYQLRRDVVFGRYENTINETMSDYCYGYGSYAYMSEYTGLDQTNISRVTDTWAVLYRVVRFSNQILYEMRDTPLSEKDRGELTGELRFLRSFAYAYLVRSWGAVPVFDESNYKALYGPRVPVNEVYDFIVSDLKYSEENLPDTPKQFGRPTKWAAKSFLTEIYMWMGKYAEARDKALEVIQSNRFSLMQVSEPDDFYKLFGPFVNGTSEEIFYLKYNRENGNNFVWMMHTTGTPYINPTQGPMGLYSLHSNRFMQDWSSDDLRKSFNLYEWNVGGIDRILGKKFIDPDQTGSVTANDYPIIKYSDVMLYYAEAACRANNGATAEAMEQLNRVHRRAYGKAPLTPDDEVDYKLSDYNTADKFIDLVLKERGYETYYEGKRYDDLKRCGKLAEYVLYTKGITITSQAAYWWPIPDIEFLYNPYFDIDKDQNPGY